MVLGDVSGYGFRYCTGHSYRGMDLGMVQEDGSETGSRGMDLGMDLGDRSGHASGDGSGHGSGDGSGYGSRGWIWVWFRGRIWVWFKGTDLGTPCLCIDQGDATGGSLAEV